MSHTPWLLVWVLSQCRLKARYSHSSFPPITYKKRESAGHTHLHDYTNAHSSTLLVFSTIERRKHVGWSLAAGITNARYHSDSDRQSMRQSHHPVSTSCHRFFIQVTVKIYQKLCLCLDPMELVSLWGDIISQLAHPTKYEDLKLCVGNLSWPLSSCPVSQIIS